MPALLPGGCEISRKRKRTMREEAPYSPGWVGCMRPPEKLQIGKSSKKEVHKNGKPVI